MSILLWMVLPMWGAVDTHLQEHFCEPATYLFGCQPRSASGVYYDTLQSVTGSDSIVELRLSYGTPTASEQYRTVCGGTYLFGCQLLTASGTYYDYLTNAAGCDSVATLHLTVAAPRHTNLTDSIVLGGTYLFGCEPITPSVAGTTQYTGHLLSALGCDSTVTLSLRAYNPAPVPPIVTTISDITCGGAYLFGCQTLTQSGTYRDTLTTGSGQDSIVVLHLTIAEPKTIALADKVTEGETYLFGCKTIEATTVGTIQASDTLTTVQGCDSIITLTLTVEAKSPVTTDSTVISETVCGGTYLFGCSQLTQSGTYRDTLTGTNGQDSITVLHLTVAEPKTITLTDKVTEGETYLFGCKTIEATTVGTIQASDTLTTFQGCDSIITLTLTVEAKTPVTPDSTVISETVCGGTYLFGCAQLTQSGTYRDTLTTGSGQDSIIVLHLNIAEPKTITLTDIVTEGETYLFGCRTIEATTVGTIQASDTLTTVQGCDSIITLTLTVEAKSPVTIDSTVISETVCGGTYLFGCAQLTQSGIYRDTLTGTNGQDSIIVLHLTIAEPQATATTAVICEGDSLLFGCQALTLAGTYTDTLRTVEGCDSIITLTLSVNPVQRTTTEATVCAGDAYTFMGKTCTEAGTYIDTTASVLTGCDSIVTLTLHVQAPVTAPEESKTVCAGELPYTWLDHYTVTTAGTYRDTAYYATGCDSVYYTLHLTVNEPTMGDTTATICRSELPYTWHGQTLTQAGTATYTTTNVAGCDSVVTLTLYVQAPVMAPEESKTVCAGELPYTWLDHYTINAAGTYRDTAYYVAGCDSVYYTLHLTVNEPTSGDTTATICRSDLPYTWHGQTLNAAGTATYTTTNMAGCDSVVTLTLVVNECLMRIENHITDTVCAGTVYEGRLSTYTIDALTTWTDSVRATVNGTPTDSVFYYTVMPYTFTLPNPTIVELRAVCGRIVNTADATAAINAFIASEPLYAPNATVTWEIQATSEIAGTMGGWHTLTMSDTVRGDMEQIHLRYSITTDCGILTSDIYTVVVERATPDNEASMDNVPAVSKYSDQLLMINLRAIETMYGWKVSGEEVTWYRMTGTSVDLAKDEQVGTGYYYTVGNQLRGSYYAVIDHEWQEGDTETSHCGGLLRTVILVCGTEQSAPRLLPTVARPQEEIRVLDLDPAKTTEIRVYSAEGKVLYTCTEQAATEHLLHAAGTAGVYMVEVRTEDTVVTLRYIVKQ